MSCKERTATAERSSSHAPPLPTPAFTAAGCRVLRFTWRTEPETALRRVRALLT
jgi:hypothetical protein